MTLTWVETDDGWHRADTGATTYFIHRTSKLPDVWVWTVEVTHVELDTDENGDTTLVYLGWGHDVADAKQLVQLVVDSPLGDDSARMEWNRQHQRELAASIRDR